MASSHNDPAREVFIALAELPPEQRVAKMREMCAGDERLQSQVEALLKASEQAHQRGVMTDPTADLRPASGGHSAEQATSDAGPMDLLREGPGAKIGPYKLLQPIGEGGFGSVFMAEQERPVRRKVALKIIKLGMDTRQVVARFEQERQALALMDHPHIARVLDAGATESGRPYFVMELVKGAPIVEYCDLNRLSIADRMELFLQVCAAVQHAHTKGIIHRDLKPSNILVATLDGRPSAKVIDFGIAKATNSRLTERTLFTEHRQLIGTPEYMSPEQAEGSLDIDTRTDVYSLGVLLYELLTGTTPFSIKELRSAAYAEVQRIIREVEPPKPSTRISQSGATVASIAARRHTEPRKLGGLVRGELDWIVMKALEKDRQRRYETANGLSMDVQRYLAGESVVAAPPSAAYRFRKLIRRHKATATGAAVVALALLLGMAGTGWQASRAAEERDLAIAAKEAEKLQRAAAERERDNTALVAEFMSDLLKSAGPSVTRGRDTTMLKEMLDLATARLESGELKGAPEAEIRLVNEVSQTYLELAQLATAERLMKPNVERARIHFSQVGNGDGIALARALQVLGQVWQNREKWELAEPLLEESLAMYRRLVQGGDKEIGTALVNLGGVRFAREDPTGIDLCREGLAVYEQVLPAGHDWTLIAKVNLAEMYFISSDATSALRTLEEALADAARDFHGDHPAVAHALATAARILRTEAPDRALALAQQSLEMRRRVFGDAHPTVAESLLGVGALLGDRGDNPGAERALQEALEILRSAQAPRTEVVLLCMEQQIMLLLQQGKLAEAEAVIREQLSRARTFFGEDSARFASLKVSMVTLHMLRGDVPEAVAHCRDALNMARRHTRGDSLRLASLIETMGLVLVEAGDLEPAEAHLREALDMFQRMRPSQSSVVTDCMGHLAAFLLNRDKADAAVPLFEQVFAARQQSLGRKHPSTLEAMAGLGLSYKGAGRIEEAILLLEEVRAAVDAETALVIIAPQLLDAYTQGVAHNVPGCRDKAAALLKDSLASARAHLPAESLALADQLAQFGLLLLRFEAWAEADPLVRECLAIREAKIPDDWKTFNTRSLLGGALLGQGKHAEAEPLLLGGYAGLKEREAAIPPQGRDRLPETVERLVALYKATGDAAKAQEWQAKLDASDKP